MRLIAVVAAVVLVCATHALADNSANTAQSGSSSSGDAVGGPSIGVARSGSVRVVATNVSGPGGAASHTVSLTPGDVVSTNVQGPTTVTSGDASGSNTANTFVGTETAPSGLRDVFGAALR
jgi:hypothetical protein